MLNFTVIKLSISLLIGIVLEFYLKIPVGTLLPIGFFLFLLFGSLYFRSRRLLIPDIFFGISFLLISIFLGIFTAAVHLPNNQPRHYIHQLKEKEENFYLLKAEVTEVLKPTTKFDRYIISAENLNDVRAKGKILLNLNKDSISVAPETGDILMMPVQLLEIKAPLNPHQFNYKLYLERSGILKQAYVNPRDVQNIGFKALNIFRIAERSRKKIIKKLETANFSQNEFAIIKALLLGERRDISPITYANYAAAGAIHILAISGLHIGILLLLVTSLLKPLHSFKYGRLYSFLITLIFLWGFALLTGLAPSVVRAVFMFSIIAIGLQLRRTSSITNSLFISLFFLLLINPNYVYQVGFQLSYLAILGIVSFQPLLQKLWNPENRIILYFWKLLTVSIAAQIAVFPLSLFYFHQFPGLFFITNLVILPFLGLILGLGLMIIILSLLDLLPSVLVDLFEWIILQMNNFVAFIASFESFVFKDISFSLIICISTYLLLYSAYQLFRKLSYSNITVLLFSIIIFQFSLIQEKKHLNQTTATFFHTSKESLIGIKTHQKLKLYHSSLRDRTYLGMISKYKTEEHINSVENLSLSNAINILGKKVLIIDSSGIYNLKDFEPEIVLLRNSPKINLNRMVDELKPDVVIADGSNYRYMIEQWKKTLQTKNSHFHATAEKGAFILYPSEILLK